jgi:flagellar basal body rod protein FlgB
VIFDPSIGNLEQALKSSAARQAVISHNLANANTPGYEALEFDEELGRAIARQDKKKVIIEEEMAALSDNSVRYSSYVKLLSTKLNIIRTIATQGRK